MGQGLYTALVYGAIDPPVEETDEEGYTELAEWYQEAEDAVEKRHEIRIMGAYEARPYFRGVLLAASNGFLARWSNVTEWDRYAVVTDSLAEFARSLPDGIFDRACAAWEDIRVAGREAGVEVPEGRILLINDWD